MKLGFIYKITNTKNGKIYIGKTTTSIYKRFREHLYSASCITRSYTSYLYNAINDYGKENFIIEEIDRIEFDDEKVLDERERYFIKKLHSQDPSIGYNIQEGGEGGAVRSKNYKPTQKQLDALLRSSHLPASEKQRKQLAERRKNCIVSDTTKEKLRQGSAGRVPIHKGSINKRPKKDKLNSYLKDG